MAPISFLSLRHRESLISFVHEQLTTQVYGRKIPLACVPFTTLTTVMETLLENVLLEL